LFLRVQKKIVSFSLIVSLSFIFVLSANAKDPFADHLRVGIYDNPPKLFLDADQNAKGIFPGIIKDIAEKEGWKIQFIPMTFKQGLDELKNGTIDIMQDVAWSKQRSQIYGYSQETVMVSWGRIYKRKGMTINTLIDLKGKRIAFMDGGIYSEGPDGLKQLMKKFEIEATFIPVKNYKQVFETIHQGSADVGVVNRLYGKKNKYLYDIENTPVLISPISIRFTFNKTSPITPQLISIIDSHLKQMKKNDESIYYDLIDEYIREPKAKVPDGLKKILWGLLILSVFLTALGIISNWQIRKKTGQLRQRDKEFKESEKKFRNIFESLQDVYFKTSLTGEILMVSPSMEKISGFSVDELVSQNVDRMYHNIDDRQAMVDRILEHTMIRDYKLKLRKKDYETYWVSINADLFYDNKKTPMGITGILRDITQQKETEEKLTKREERFREMARLLPYGIVETDIDLNITYTNQAGFDLLGYTQKDIDNGLKSIDILHPDDWEKLLQRVEMHLNQEPTDPSEYRMYKKDGTCLVILFNSNAIFNNGKAIGFRGSMVDLTEIKQLQKEIIRTQKLESTGLLAGGIAHDFNNILLGLFGNLSMAKNELASTSEAYKLIEEAEKSMSRAKDLTTQLLTFAQGGDPVKKDITLDQIVRETALFHLAGSNIKFNMEKPESLWQIHADKGQIGQVISNLVINARQAMPNGGQLFIKFENAAISGNKFSSFELDQYVKLSVSDQGIGISEEYLEKIFDPYFTTKQDGSGLGLAIVHSIILKHQGYISVNSSPGQGTTFVIYLPGVEKTDQSNNTENENKQSQKRIKPCRILVMDDDPLVRDVSTRMLSTLGHAVDLCEDGQSAIALYQKAMTTSKPYDLAILDLTIPGGLGGKDTIKKLLTIDPDIRVVVASGYSNDPVMANYKKYGFKAMATKPYTVEKIESILFQALSD